MTIPNIPTTGAVTLVPAGSIEWNVIKKNAADVIVLRAENENLKVQIDALTERVVTLGRALDERTIQLRDMRRIAEGAEASLQSYKDLVASLGALAKAQSPEATATAAAS